MDFISKRSLILSIHFSLQEKKEKNSPLANTPSKHMQTILGYRL